MLICLKSPDTRLRSSYFNQRYLAEHDLINGKTLRVIAQFDTYGYKYFLVLVPENRSYSYITLFETKDFDIIDNSRPDDWKELYWHRWKPFYKRRKGSDFDFRLTYFCGPLALLNDEDFLFDVIDNEEKALIFFTAYETHS